MKTKKPYILSSLILFTTEALIAIFFKDSFIRPILGDYLVVILLYCLLKSVVNLKVQTASIIVLLTAYLVETLQWLDIHSFLSFEPTTLSRLILGTSFDWWDMLAYTLGVVTILIIERYRLKSNKGEN